MFILIQSRQRNTSMWFTLRDQSQIPALNIWNSSSSYLQQTGQDQSGDKKEGSAFLEGGRDPLSRSVSLTSTCNGTHKVLIHVPVLGLIPFFCLSFFFFPLATICFSSHVSSLYIYLSSRQWIQDRFSCQGIPLPNENKWIKHKRSSFKLKIGRKKPWRKPISEGKHFFLGKCLLNRWISICFL